MRNGPAVLDPEKPALIDGVSWADYDAMTDQEGLPGGRYTYDDGRLEIMPPPSVAHEKRTVKLGDLTRDFLLLREIPFIRIRSTTLKRQDTLKGTDPDDAFYIDPDALGTSADVDDLDLAIHPPPNLVIEIDRTSSSIPREPILAALEVAELWRWDLRREAVAVRRLGDAGYVDSPASVVLPGLPMDALAEHVRLGRHLRDDQVAVRWASFLRGM